jgi:hypothetical protein
MAAFPAGTWSVRRCNGSWRILGTASIDLVHHHIESILADQAALVVGMQDSSEDAENIEQILAIASNWRERLRTESFEFPRQSAHASYCRNVDVARFRFSRFEAHHDQLR